MVADARKLGLSQHFDWRQPGEFTKRNLDRLHGAGKIGDA